MYGDGMPTPALTVPCDETERPIAGSMIHADDTEITRQEMALEQACENGQITGAMPADI
jgi:hypothetical protein